MRFQDERHLLRIIDRIVSAVGRRVDESQPWVDARLADGSRINAIIPPCALDGPLLSIRKFARDPLTIERLIANGALTEEMATLLNGIVKARLNLLISGGTGSGKTTLLNAVSSYIDARERIITIEDSAELQLQQATSRGWRRARRTSKGEARSCSAISCAMPCACDRIGSSSARCAAPRRSTCCRR